MNEELNLKAQLEETLAVCEKAGKNVGYQMRMGGLRYEGEDEDVESLLKALPAHTRALLEAIETLDACGFGGDPSKQLEMINESLNKIAAILDGAK